MTELGRKELKKSIRILKMIIMVSYTSIAISLASIVISLYKHYCN